MSAKLAIIELFSRYLLCLDERRFDIDSITDVTAEVRCNISGYYNSFDVDSGSMAAGVINFSAVHTAEGWRIQRLRRKTKFNYNLSILIKNQEEFIS